MVMQVMWCWCHMQLCVYWRPYLRTRLQAAQNQHGGCCNLIAFPNLAQCHCSQGNKRGLWQRLMCVLGFFWSWTSTLNIFVVILVVTRGDSVLTFAYINWPVAMGTVNLIWLPEYAEQLVCVGIVWGLSCVSRHRGYQISGCNCVHPCTDGC